MTFTTRSALIFAAFASLGACSAAPPAGPQILTSIPNGKLNSGQVVLVDDGKCPAGQITQVIGGSNRYLGTDTLRPGSARQVSCVPRP